MKSFYENNSARVRLPGNVSKIFTLINELRQRCGLSLSLFNLYMDGVVGQVYERLQGGGVNMID